MAWLLAESSMQKGGVLGKKAGFDECNERPIEP
jgi:hypothetical protein